MTHETRELNPLAARLPEIRRHADNPTWLDDHADELYTLIRRYSRDYTLDDAVTALKLVAPHYLKRPDYARWAGLFTHILPLLMEVGRRDDQQQVWYQLGQYGLVGDHPQSAQAAFQNAADSAKEQNRKHDWVEACIGLLTASAFQASGVGRTAYDDLLDYARQHPNPFTRALIYKAAAQYHTVHAEASAALSYADQALSICWEQLERSRHPDNELERMIGQLHTVMASNARWLGEYEDAESHIHKAQSYLARLPYEHDLYVSLYEEGALYLTMRRYNRGIALHKRVIDYFSQQGYPFYVTAAHHSTGIAYSELGDYAEAQHHLKAAYDGWRQLKNTVQQINVKHAHGYMYLCMGEYERAIDVLSGAKAEAQAIENDSRRTRMETKIQEDIDDAQRRLTDRRQGEP